MPCPCDAVILSAGWGTRLRPLTMYRPKVAVPVRGKPLLQRWIDILSQCQVKNIFVNVHACWIFLKNFLNHLTVPSGVRIHPVFESNILGSGGPLLNILHCTDAPCLLVVNGDIFLESGPDIIKNMLNSRSDGILMAFLDNAIYNNVVMDLDGNIVRFRSQPTPEEEKNGYRAFAYMGIQIIDRRILQRIRWDGQFVDLIDMYSSLLETGCIKGRLFPSSTAWYDVGSVKNYFRVHFPDDTNGVYAGKCSKVEPGASVRRSILWDDVIVKEGSVLYNCIVLDGVVVRGNYHRSIISRHGVYSI